MRILTPFLLAIPLFLSGCDGPLAHLSDAELAAQSSDCTRLGGSRKIKALTCDEVAKECEKRASSGRRVCN
jgi:hypothetical protein